MKEKIENVIKFIEDGEFILAKHRNGETGTEYWTHNDSLTKISDYPPMDYEYQTK